MLAVRRHQRIRPARLGPSRGWLAGVVVASTIAVAGAGVAIGARQAETTVELGSDQGSAGIVRLSSSVGPVELSAGPAGQGPRLRYQASWLLQGPDLDREPWPGRLPATDLRLSCDTPLPCRATSYLQLPAGTGAEIRASGGEILIGSSTGMVAAIATGDHDVIVGPVAGRLEVETDGGDVVANGLSAAEVEVRTVGGAVDLHFLEPPRSVVVEAGPGPVTIELPPGRYAVSVEGYPTPAIEVEHDEAADNWIRVDGRGPVRILQTT